MAVQRLNLTQIEAAILEACGFTSSALAPWGSSATLYVRINTYGQRLPMRLNQVGRELVSQGLLPPDALPIHLGCWRTVSTSGTSTTTGIQVTAATSLCYMPADYDEYISFYDVTEKRDIPAFSGADKYLSEELVNATPGPARAIELQGFAAESTNWRKTGYLYPTPSGTPSIRLTYWRLPAVFPGSSPNAEYADIDPRYQDIFVIGPVADLTRPTDPETYATYSQLEHDMLVDMCLTAGGK